MITEESYFNPKGIDTGKIVGGNPTGFVDFNDTSLKWANNSWQLMSDLTWFPQEVDCSNEAKSFKLLSDNEQMIYKIVFANLSFLDSSQESHLLDFRQNVTNKVLQSTLTYQAFQESLHSKSYATVLAEIGNATEVFEMYKTEQILMDRNQRVAEMFARHINGSSVEKMVGSAMASVMLEGVLFLTSFSYVFVLGEKMQGSSSMVQMISRDEISVHAPIFKNIFNNIVSQNKPSKEAIDSALALVLEAVNIEKDFASYVCNTYPILGITEELLHRTIEGFANERLKLLKLPVLFTDNPKTSLQKLVDKFAKINDSKSNFFESSVKAYSVGSINMDF